MAPRRMPVSPVVAPFALPPACAALLCVGAVAAALHGRLAAPVVVGLCAGITGLTCLVAGAATALPLAAVAWMSATAFAHAPYGQLRPAGHTAVVAAVAVAGAAAVGVLLGAARRLGQSPERRTLEGVTRLGGFAGAVDRRRRLLGIAVAVALLPALTALLCALRSDLTLADELLVYLTGVVGIAVLGGFWPAIVAAVASSLLLNWFFTEPFHTFTIAAPDNLLALLLFVVVAVSVSSVVHLAARRARQAARSRSESEMLLRLARMVLGGEDTPAAVLEHLRATVGVGAELLERSGPRWVRVASAGETAGPVRERVVVRDDLRLVLHGDVVDEERRPLVEAAAGQSAAALDRDRLRTQAAQAEVLAAGNRMRTALLAAVSHDLRTPLASIKASITSLRQRDVEWSPDDQAALMETIDESADRLDALIANLLDMSRVQTGALQPYLQPVAVDEVAPLALRGLSGADAVDLDIPEDLPLVVTDPGLLERALANLLSNALRFSPIGRPPQVSARADGSVVQIAVVDHGPGVATTDRERMFEPFQRLGDRPAGNGVGLGLAVARGFVEALGGSVTASDTAGGGLTMTVSLPAAASSSPTAQVRS